MAVDPQAQALLDAAASLPPVCTLPVEEARAMFKAHPLPGTRAAEVASVADRAIPGPGEPLRLRVYTPPGAGPHPLLVFFHGGGFVVCDLDTHDSLCRNLCAGAGCVVASVDYRLAPEHRFPAAADDCLAATRWAAEHAAELGADPARLAVAGDSAGGTLAAVTALRVRDEGGPRLAGQLLIYPATDLGPPATPSFAEFAEGYGLREGFAVVLGQVPERRFRGVAAARFAHARARFARPPPALVVTAEFDPLRDEAERYGERLRAAGVPTTVSRYGGMIHAFFLLPGLVDKAGAALEEACAWLRGAFAGRR